jgi:hypothetical protein
MKHPRCLLRGLTVEKGHPTPHHKEQQMARSHLTPRLAEAEDAVTALFCLVEDAYRLLDPREARSYEPLRSLSNSEIFTLALFQQLRGVESERSFLREAERFFAHLFPGVLGLWPSSFNRSVRGMRRFLEPLRRFVLPELVGDPETPIVDSTLLAVLHPRQVAQSPGFEGAAWARWGSFAVHGVKLHVLCATNRVPVRRTERRGTGPSSIGGCATSTCLINHLPPR